MSGFSIAQAARADASATVGAEDALKRVSDMAAALAVAKEVVEKAQAALTAANERVASIESEGLPELMRELKLKMIMLDDGSKVDVIDDFQCGITNDRKETAHSWIRKQGDGGIIKAAVTVPFGKDEIEDAEKLAADLRKLTNHEVITTETIHWQTLKSYLKEKREKGQISGDIATLFGIFPFVKAKITPPKAKKGALR